MNKKERYQAFVDHFSVHLPNPTTELNYCTPYELLVAVILSAQCTDKRVNMVTPVLFRDFPTPEALAYMTAEEIYPYIRSISYPHSKAKYLVETAKMLVHEFDGKVPGQSDDLQKLLGVGRKTAHVILATIFHQPVMPVDTHVMRVSKRMGLVNATIKTPLAIEKELMANLPKAIVSRAHHWLVLHGRYRCTARSPQCTTCPFLNFCPYYQKQKTR